MNPWHCQKPRVAILIHRLGPYHAARLHAASRLLNLVVLQGCRRDKTYAWEELRDFDSLSITTLCQSGDIADWTPSAIQRCLREKLPALAAKVMVVPGWSSSLSLNVLSWSRQAKIPVVALSESTSWDHPRIAWREWIKRRLVSFYSSAFVGGRPQAEYLTRLGVPPDRIFQGYTAVDNEHFQRSVAQVQAQKEAIRAQYNLPVPFFLASARFVEKKNLHRLIQAYARYRALATRGTEQQASGLLPPWDLVLLGDGPLKPQLCGLVSNLSLEKSVHLPGFIQYPSLPLYYGLASAFVHASTSEQWGLVVNEAMASSLPVLVSSRCGCAADLVRDGINGYSFDPLNTDELAHLMVRVSDSTFPLTAFREASQRIVSNWSLEKHAEGLRLAVETACRLPRARRSHVDSALLRWLASRQTISQLPS